MATIVISNLFSVENGSPVNGVISGTGERICYGEGGPVGAVSEIGKKHGNKTPKINSSADSLLNFCFGANRIGVSAENESIVCFETADELCVFDFSAKVASYYGTHHAHEAAMPYIAYCLTQTEEGQTWLKNFYNTDTFIFDVKGENAFKFCDMVYYHAIEAFGKKAELTKRELSEVELKQLRKTNSFKNVVFPLLNETIINGNSISPDFQFVTTAVVGKKETKIADFNADEFGDDVMMGNYIVDHEWTERQKHMIPDIMLTDNHVFTKMEANLIKSLHEVMTAGHESYARGDDAVFRKYGDMINLMFYGAAAGGKSEAATMIAAALQVPIARVTGSPQTEEGVFEGQTIMRDGKLTSENGIFLDTFQYGGIIVIEEVNLINPGILQGCLSQALEKPYEMYRFKVDAIKRHPMCLVIATQNPGYAGSRVMNSAFMSRFQHKYKFTDIDKELFGTIMAKNGIEDSKVIETVFRAYNAVRDYLSKDEDLCTLKDECSLREAIAMGRDIIRGMTPTEAARYTLLSAIDVENEEVANVLEGMLSSI